MTSTWLQRQGLLAAHRATREARTLSCRPYEGTNTKANPGDTSNAPSMRIESTILSVLFVLTHGTGCASRSSTIPRCVFRC